jgi:hypothetical protein
MASLANIKDNQAPNVVKTDTDKSISQPGLFVKAQDKNSARIDND